MTLYIYRATLLNVLDGATLDLRVSLGFDLYADQRIRLYGISTPELNSPYPTEREKAAEAKAFVVAYLPTGPHELTLQTHKDRREQYGRYLGEVSPADAATSLNAALVEAGLAAVYMG